MNEHLKSASVFKEEFWGELLLSKEMVFFSTFRYVIALRGIRRENLGWNKSCNETWYVISRRSWRIPSISRLSVSIFMSCLWLVDNVLFHPHLWNFNIQILCSVSFQLSIPSDSVKYEVELHSEIPYALMLDWAVPLIQFHFPVFIQVINISFRGRLLLSINL